MQSDLTEFYKKQISLTEWFEAIGHPDAAKLRLEDNNKRDRLNVLHQIIALPFDKPTAFPLSEVITPSAAFAQFLKDRGDEPCAIHLIPDDPTLPKFRMRGHTIAEAAKWVADQGVAAEHYRASFALHSESKWATILIVSKQGIYGELTKGLHNELTQGLYSTNEPLTFQYDFRDWMFSRDEPGAKKHLQEIIKHLHVTDPAKRSIINKELDASFAHDYLEGYFETTASEERGIWFIDYNRLLGGMYASAAPTSKSGDALVTGRPSSPGKASGIVRIVHPGEVAAARLAKNEILVCKMTTPDYVPLMQQAAAIVTDLGGVLSHAAIIARELKKPCITGAKNATTILKEGQTITVDADSGAVR